MKRHLNFIFITVVVFVFTSAVFTQRIVSHDKRFDALIPPDVRLEKLADGFGWTEGPLWDKKNSRLLFSDVVNNTLYFLNRDGSFGVLLKPSGYTGVLPFTGREPGSNGLTFDPQGSLVLNQHGNRRVVRLEAGGAITVLADQFDGKRLNSPNDLVFKSNGDLYFTDPPFGLPKVLEDPEKQLPFQGVYRLSRDGKLTLLTKEVDFPNGIAFSPDEETLYISNADRKNAIWYAFDVNADGTLRNRRTIFNVNELAKTKPGVPDGMKVDKNGYLFAAAPGGIHVVDPKDGALLGSFEFDVATSNCNWGDDGSVLYITSNTAIYRIRLNTRGAAF